MIKWLNDLWCDWTHGGGKIERDELGRINWRCSKCGRWSDDPTPLKTERSICGKELDATMKAHINSSAIREIGGSRE